MQFNKNYFLLFMMLLLSLAVLVACGNASAGQTSPSPAPLLGNEDVPPVPTLNPQKVAQGQELYTQHCAACHGANGEGQPDWKIQNEDDSFKPPPHDNSGHTWHHDDSLLLAIIARGSDFPQTKMPTFGNRLSDEEILVILEYLKSWWGPEERAFQWQVSWQARQQQ